MSMNEQKKYDAIFNLLIDIALEKQCVNAETFCKRLKEEYGVTFSHIGNKNPDTTIYNYLGDLSQECIDEDLPIITTIINSNYEPKPFHRLFDDIQYRADEEKLNIIANTPKKERTQKLKDEVDKVFAFNWEGLFVNLELQEEYEDEQGETLNSNENEIINEQKFAKISLRDPFLKKLKEQILNRAKNKCENKNCKTPQSFTKEDGSVYLEIHHKKFYVDCKKDNEEPHTLENCVALCANCHRQAHYGKEKPIYENRN